MNKITTTEAAALLPKIYDAQARERAALLEAIDLRAKYNTHFNPVKVGDKVTILTEYTKQEKTVEIVATMFQTFPKPTFHYRGVVLNKNGKPSNRQMALEFFTEHEINPPLNFNHTHTEDTVTVLVKWGEDELGNKVLISENV